jgi:ABC-type thiamin/hydroxymethylpyrimidine transport system permease subunit
MIRRRYFSTFQLIQIMLLSALAVVAQVALRLPAIGLPGHAGLFDTAILVIVAGVVPRPGSAILAGVTCGLLSALLGLGYLGPLNTLFTFILMGIGVDLSMSLSGRRREHLAVTLVAGIAGNFGRLFARWAWGILSGAPAGFVALGLARSIVGYLIFGALGGLLAGLTLIALRRAGYFAYIREKR